MSIFRIVILIGILFLSFTSCKKLGRETTEIITKETTERAAKETVELASKGVAKGTTERMLKTLTKKELRSLDWSKLLRLIRKENINLAEALSKLDGSFQKKIVKAIQGDYEFYSALVSSNTVVDEFSVFTKNAPLAANNINVFKYFVKSRDLERRFGVQNAMGNLSIKEEAGIFKFFRSSDNSVIAEMREGVLLLKEPYKVGSEIIDNNSILKKNLIPNAVYKIKGANGLTYLYHVDDLGRFSKIEAKGVSAKELSSNVIYIKENFNLGSNWNAKLKQVSQTSKGSDIDATLIFKYVDDGTTPSTVKADIKAHNKKIISESFENLDNVAKKVFSTEENALLLEKFASKTGLSGTKKANLLNEMSQDEELAKLIHSNPVFNIRRWANTRNHVDQKLLAKDGNGIVKNGRVYAGNIYYFNPHLNSGLKARLERKGYAELKKFGKLSYEDLLRLDKVYPGGVPFTKQGYPDFSKVAFKARDGRPLRVNIGELSGDSKIDIAKAKKIAFKLGYPDVDGYTWHHIENTTELIRVPSTIHQLIDHSGGMSTRTAQQMVQQAA